MSKKQALIDYITDNSSEGLDIARDINSYDGSLDFLDYFTNDEEFFNMFFGDKVMEAVRASHYGEYEFCDDYVKFNAYGNLESCSEYDLLQKIETYAEEIADRIIELYSNLSLPDDVEDIINEYYEDEDNTEDTED